MKGVIKVNFRKCTYCNLDWVIKQGNMHLCVMHYRICQMRASASRNNKFVPTREQIEQLVRDPFDCIDCFRTMNWRGVDGGKDTVASLQHYRDGSLGIVCRSCNTRHAFMPDDSYRQIDTSFKYCPTCKKVKPRSDYGIDNNRSGVIKTKSYCNSCEAKRLEKYRKENKDVYNAYQRAWRAKRKDAMLKAREE